MNWLALFGDVLFKMESSNIENKNAENADNKELKNDIKVEARNPYTMNTGVLAFLGDSVYELYIRDLLVGAGMHDPDAMHRACTKYVRAESQAMAIKAMMKEHDGRAFLTDEEIALVKRARNHKMPNRSRSAGPVEYKLATAFEALVGYLYLTGDSNRLGEVMQKAAALIAKGE